MRKNYFFGCETAEELKREFKKLAKQLHPDNGGSAEAFKEMQAQFSKLFERLKNVHTNKNGDKWEAVVLALHIDNPDTQNTRRK